MSKAKTDGNDGWEKVTSERAPWLMKEENLKAAGGKAFRVAGFLLGRFSYTGKDKKKRFYYQVKLTDGPVVASATNEDNEREEIELGKGDVISIDESFALERDLAPLSADGGKYEVRLTYQAPTDRDKKGKALYWPIVVEKKTLKPPTHAPRVEHREDTRNGEVSEDQIPF